MKKYLSRATLHTGRAQGGTPQIRNRCEILRLPTPWPLTSHADLRLCTQIFQNVHLVADMSAYNLGELMLKLLSRGTLHTGRAQISRPMLRNQCEILRLPTPWALASHTDMQLPTLLTSLHSTHSLTSLIHSFSLHFYSFSRHPSESPNLVSSATASPQTPSRARSLCWNQKSSGKSMVTLSSVGNTQELTYTFE